jgi:hypothetical protein
MSATAPESTGPTSQRVSRLAVASCLCGVATPVVGLIVLSDVGSDISDLLTLTFPVFLLAAVVLCVLAHLAVWKSPEQLAGTVYAKAGALLATGTVCAGCLLIPAG